MYLVSIYLLTNRAWNFYENKQNAVFVIKIQTGKNFNKFQKYF